MLRAYRILWIFGVRMWTTTGPGGGRCFRTRWGSFSSASVYKHAGGQRWDSIDGDSSFLSARKVPPSQGSPSPFFPFFLAGSTSRGRVDEGGGGVSVFGVSASAFGCGVEGSSAFGGGGNVTCSGFGSVVLAAGRAFSSSAFSASAANSPP